MRLKQLTKLLQSPLSYVWVKRVYKSTAKEGLDIDDEDQRAVLTGAANSNAVYQKIQSGQVIPFCPWCKDAIVADWNHVCWDCPSFCDNRPPRPGDPLAFRLGWSVGSSTEDRHLLGFMATVRNGSPW